MMTTAKKKNIFIIDGVDVTFNGITDATELEAKNYVDYVSERVNDKIVSISVLPCSDGLVDVKYQLEGTKFERIRRITGYLTGSLDSWNDSKRAEEHDRVKHDPKGVQGNYD